MSCAEVDAILAASDDDDEDADDAHNVAGAMPRSRADRYSPSAPPDSSYKRKVVQARDILRRVLDAGAGEKIVLSGYRQLNTQWRALVQRIPDHTDITAPFLLLALHKATEAAEAEAGKSTAFSSDAKLQGYSPLRAYITLAERVHPYNKLQREIKALSESACLPTEDSPQETELDIDVDPARATTTTARTTFEQLASRNIFGADPLNPASGRRRRLPGFLLRFLHGRGGSVDVDSLMTYDPVTGMPAYLYLVLRRLFPRWGRDHMERYLDATRHIGSHDLEDALFYCTLSREMFDLLRSILHVHFDTRYFTDIPARLPREHSSFDEDKELAIEGLVRHQVRSLFEAVAKEYNCASPAGLCTGLSQAGCSQIMQWLSQNSDGELHSILCSAQSDDRDAALRALITRNRQSPALTEIEWYALASRALLCFFVID